MWKIASANEHSQQQHMIPLNNTQEGIQNKIDMAMFDFKQSENLASTKVAVLNDRLAMM